MNTHVKMSISTKYLGIFVAFKTDAWGFLVSSNTFDLIVDVHRGIGDAFPTHAVEDSAGHREAHDAEDGL